MKQATTRTYSRRLQRGLLGSFVLFVLVLALVVWAPNAVGFQRYQDGCNDPSCHGDFTSATSPKGSMFPSNSKHEMHRGSIEMNTTCNMCHTNGDQRNPFTGSSQQDGDGNSGGPGCNGCHNGSGLRLHHEANGQTFCFDCHSRQQAPAENVDPPYYSSADTAVRNPCNAVMAARTGENWSLNDFEGIDNDGDNLYDAADPDCSVAPSGAGAVSLLMVSMDPAGDLLLSWAGSCQAGDTDYGLYEGVLPQISTSKPAPPRDFLTHQFVQCSTGGGTTATVTPSGDFEYYLIVPSNGSDEGSYGVDSKGSERGPGGTACATQTVLACS